MKNLIGLGLIMVLSCHALKAQKNYCLPAHTGTCHVKIYSFSLGPLINNNNGCIPNYTDYSNTTNLNVVLIEKKKYPLSISSTSFTAGNYGGFSIWMDSNNDTTFSQSELIWISDSCGYAFTDSILIPYDNAFYKKKRLRVRSNWSSTTQPQDPCATLRGGETEDYTIIIDSIQHIIASVDKISEEPILTIYPNPTSGNIYLENLNKQHFYCKVFSITGELILTFENEKVINLERLRQGIYILEIIANEKRHIKKIVKQE